MGWASKCLQLAVLSQKKIMTSLDILNLWQKEFEPFAFYEVDRVWNVMAHAQKPDFVFRRNGGVYLNRWGRQFSRLLAADVCASTVVMLGTPCSEGAWEYWLPTPFVSFPFTSLPVRHRVPSGFNWALKHINLSMCKPET